MLEPYFLLTDLPALIKAIINGFTSKASSKFDTYEPPRPADWMRIFIHLTLPLVLLMFAKPIAHYFAKDVSDDR